VTQPSEPLPGGCALAAAYAGVFLVWYVGVSGLVSAVAGYDFITSAAGLSVLVGSVGLGGVWLGDRLRRLADWTPRETWGLGSGPPRARIAAAAGLGGLSLGIVGGWLAEHVGPHLKSALRWPEGADALATLGAALGEGPLVWRVVFIVFVVLIGPLFEELIFRGVLWRSLRGTGAVVTVLVTSIAFAAYHADPAQAIGVLPLALFLGLLRYAGASLVPCILAHCINNGLATTLALSTDPSAPTPGSLTLLAGLVGISATLLAVAGLRGQRPG